MIGRLCGTPRSDELDATLILDVGGVGYELTTPLGTMGRLARDDEGRVVLHVHTNVREDAIELFGFGTSAERDAFRVLIGINKVGPKLALNVLSAVSVEELVALVSMSDVTQLTRIPGVGKKTAERMILELQDKLAVFAVEASLPRRTKAAAPSPAASAGPGGVLRDALVRMGFKPAQAERAVGQLDDLDRPLGDLIREALALLS